MFGGTFKGTFIARSMRTVVAAGRFYSKMLARGILKAIVDGPVVVSKVLDIKPS
jgi:hypothetical protein